MKDEENINLLKNHDNEVMTFGCRLNIYESQVMKELASQAGLNNTVIVNTCAVTAEAERQARQAIRKIRRERPDAKIIVTGCGAQINPDKYGKMPEVNQVIGNDEKMKLETYKAHQHERVLVNDIMSVKETANHLVSGFDGKVRAYVQVQNGCDHRCTFCTIPYGRGNSRSVPIGAITEQIQKLCYEDYKEIAFTGVDITAYGADLPGQPTLGQMIRRVLALVPDLKRLRLSSLDPVEIDEDLWRLIGEEPRLLPHLHMSLQAGDDMVLKRMKRRHLRADAIGFCKKARELRPDVTFGADLIAGFPTETNEMAANTLRIVDECDLTYLHVFPYSPREGTPAAKMPQVAGPMIKKRAKELREKGQQALEKYYINCVGKTMTMLVEAIEDGVAKGKTDTFASIIVENNDSMIEAGSIIEVKIDSYTDSHLKGMQI